MLIIIILNLHFNPIDTLTLNLYLIFSLKSVRSNPPHIEIFREARFKKALSVFRKVFIDLRISGGKA